MDKNYYVSFDQAINKTGYCVWENGKYATHGLIDYSKQKNGKLEGMISSIIKVLQIYKPTSITIEDTAYQRNIQAFKSLCQLQGAILCYCSCNDICVSIYAPSKWRSILGIANGRSVKRQVSKQEAIEYVESHFGISPTEDEAESICIGCAVLQNINEGASPSN